LGFFHGIFNFMTITLNGETEMLEAATLSIRGMLKAKGWSFPLIVVKVNGQLVSRSDWDKTTIGNGDVVEAAHLMSGG